MTISIHLGRAVSAGLLLGLPLLGTACERAAEPPEAAEFAVTFESAPARILTERDTFRLNVEIAETVQQRRIGLMRRVTSPRMPE